MRLGIFDSGIGGKAIAESLALDFPDAEILRVDDHANVPYGAKTLSDVRHLTNTAIKPLLAAHCDVIVIACNTATAAAIEDLRANYPEQKFIGLEPMVKPAALATKTGTIAVCATPATLASVRYQNLKQKYAPSLTIIEPNCSTWARMIEDNTINEQHITETIRTTCDQGADVIVLACTHYHWIRELIETIAAGRATIIDPSQAITQRIKTLLQT